MNNKLSTKETQDLIWKQRSMLVERRQGKTREELIRRANKPKK